MLGDASSKGHMPREGEGAMVRRGHLITVVGTFMIGCVVVVVGCSWVRSEAPKEEQASGSITVGSIGSRLPDSSVLRINGITYDGKLVGQQLREEDLGPEVAEVTPVVNEQGTTST